VKIKAIGLAVKPGMSESGEEIRFLVELLKKYGVEVVMGDDLYQKSSVILSLGGDGTFLGTARRGLIFNKPILGVNFGKLGFLAEASFDRIEEIIRRLMEGEYKIKQRMVIRAEAQKENSCEVYQAINELVFRGVPGNDFVHLKLNIGGRDINSYRGDGLIVASPTGSTAYNLSAGGPMVYPYSEQFIFTPICSHSLTQRPLVLPTTCSDIGVIMADDQEMEMIIDGQDRVRLSEAKIVKIMKSKYSVPVVCFDDRDYFEVLKEKLNWGDHR